MRGIEPWFSAQRIGLKVGRVSIQWAGALRGVFVGATSIGWRPFDHPVGFGPFFIWRGSVKVPRARAANSQPKPNQKRKDDK